MPQDKATTLDRGLSLKVSSLVKVIVDKNLNSDTAALVNEDHLQENTEMPTKIVTTATGDSNANIIENESKAKGTMADEDCLVDKTGIVPVKHEVSLTYWDWAQVIFDMHSHSTGTLCYF